jgi:hypothetical protein
MAWASLKEVPDLMEQFRPGQGLLPVPFINIKQDAEMPMLMSAVLLGAFVISAFRDELHSPVAIKLVSLIMVIFLLMGLLLLFEAIYIIGYCGVLPHHLG